MQSQMMLLGLAASHFHYQDQVGHQTRSTRAQSHVAYRFNTERAGHPGWQPDTFNIAAVRSAVGESGGQQFPAGPPVSRAAEACLTGRAVDGGACDDGAAATDGYR
jgi:hypothetical protein